MEKPQEHNVVRIVRGNAAREKPQDIDVKKFLRLMHKKRYVFVAVMMLVTSLIVAFGYLLPNKYEAKSMVLVERSYSPDLMKNIAAPASIEDRLKAVATIMQSRALVLKTIKALNLDLTGKTDEEVESLVAAFQKATNITNDINKSRSDADMFTVSLRHKDPVIARDYVNALVRLYIEEILSSKRDETFGLRQFLMEQVGILKEKMAAVEADIAKLNQQVEADTARMTQLNQDSSRRRLITLQKRLHELLQQYTPQHPEVQKIQDEITLLQRQVRSRQRTLEKREARSRREAIDESVQPDLGGDTADTRTRPGRSVKPSYTATEQKIKELERDRDSYQKMYDEMLAALGKSEVASRLEVQDKGGTFKVLEPAILPTRPVSPNRVLIIVLGFFAGIVAAFASVIALDNLDKSVKNEEIAGAFGLPVLAVFPYIRLPHEVRWTRIKNVLLYAVAIVYVFCVAALLTVELMS